MEAIVTLMSRSLINYLFTITAEIVVNSKLKELLQHLRY